MKSAQRCAPAASPPRWRCSRSCLLREAHAQAPAGTTNAAAELPAEELETLVSRIALYPDDLIAIILPASTNPLQIVQADRFLAKRKTDPKAPVDEKWDDAVKSLLNYPEIVTSMSGDLDWTAALGEAVVADQGERARRGPGIPAQDAGGRQPEVGPKQVVVVEKEVITIVPADPQVIYVPQYNPTHGGRLRRLRRHAATTRRRTRCTTTRTRPAPHSPPG